MTPKKIALATASGLVGLTVLGGSLAYAAGDSDTESAQELQQFLGANPDVAAVVPDVEAKTGGKVAGAEFDDENQAKGIVEFEVAMPDGSEQDVLYTLADGSMKMAAEDQDEGADDDGENEADDD